MGGGKYDYADAYSKYKVGDASDADFEKYVDAKHSSYWKLLDAYNKGEDVDTKFAGQYQHPAGLSPSQQAEYWQKRGATSKAAFGRAHAAEDEALQSGTYHGGTDVKPWEGNTAFEDWLTTKGRSDTTTDTTTDTNTAPPFYKTGGGSYGDRNYPIGLMDYTELSPLDASYGLPDTYSPWAQPDYIPDSLWNYTPPELVDWDMSNRVPWDWATKDISEYGPVDEVTKARVAQQLRGGDDQRDAAERLIGGSGYQQWDYGADEGTTTAFTMGDLEAMQRAAAESRALAEARTIGDQQAFGLTLGNADIDLP